MSDIEEKKEGCIELNLEPLKLPPDKLMQGMFQIMFAVLAKIDVLDIRLSILAKGGKPFSDDQFHEMEKKFYQEAYTFFVEKLGE